MECAGKVMVWKRDRGFGFLRSDAGDDVFVHETVLQRCGLARLASGDRVTFDLDRRLDGRARATRIALTPRPISAA